MGVVTQQKRQAASKVGLFAIWNSGINAWELVQIYSPIVGETSLREKKAFKIIWHKMRLREKYFQVFKVSFIPRD